MARFGSGSPRPRASGFIDTAAPTFTPAAISLPVGADDRASQLALRASLLLVVLNHSRSANTRGFRIEPCLSFGSALAEQVPALIQILFELAPSLARGFGGASSLFLLEELMFLINQLVHPVKNVLIFHLDSSSLART
jgi:hypothetical protein